MKKIAFGIVLIMISASCIPTSVIRGSGREAKGDFDITLSYTELAVSSGITVEFIRSETGKGLITADEEVLEHVSIIEENGRVKVSYEPYISVLSNVKTVVTMPVSDKLARLDVSSAGRVVSGERLLGSTVEIECSSAGSAEIDVDAASVTIELSSAASFSGNVVAGGEAVELTGAAKCNIAGSVDHCRAAAGSAATFRGFELVCRKAVAEASSAGNIEITATDELDASASSSGAVRYKGLPAITRRSQSSGGSVREII